MCMQIGIKFCWYYHYLSKIFTRILRSFQLPVGQKNFQVDQGSKSLLTANNSASLIVSLLVSAYTFVYSVHDYIIPCNNIFYAH